VLFFCITTIKVPKIEIHAYFSSIRELILALVSAEKRLIVHI
jgi:predicted xylose isomerase-like sugar epimerase